MDDHELEASPPPMVRAPSAPAEVERPSRLGVLRHRHYRNVWFGAAGSSIGTWMESVGVLWAMTALTTTDQWIQSGRPSAPIMMSWLGAANLCPTLVLGLVGGLAADRFNRRTMLIVTQAVMMVIAALLTIASWTDRLSPAVLIVLMLLQGIAMAFNLPAWQVLTPRLVPRDELHKAIALNSLQFNLARVLGPALGGLLMAQSGPTVLFAVNTLSFLGVILTVATTPDAPAPAGVDRGWSSAWGQSREALSFVFHNKGPASVFLGLVVFSVLAGPLHRMLPLFVSVVYGKSEVEFGTLLSVMGIGAVCGSLALKWVPAWYPRHHLIPLSISGGGLAILLLSAAPTMVLAVPFLFATGFFWMWSFTSCITAMQLLVDDSMRGRVLSITNTAVFGAMPLGSFAVAAMGEGGAAIFGADEHSALSVQLGMGIASAVLLSAGLVMLIFRTPEVDGIKPGDPGYDRKPGLVRGVTAHGHRPRRSTPSDSTDTEFVASK